MGKRLRVLVVEDSEDDTLLVLAELRRSGYELLWESVDSAEDMREALEREVWDVVISDYAMPGFNAFGTLSVLKEMELDLPCVIVSGTIGEETAVEVMKAGASDYVMKDNLKRLVPAIERELRESKVRQDRLRAIDALEQSEARYRSLVDNLDMGVTLLDPDFNVVMTNAAQMRLFNGKSSGVIGRKCHEVFAELKSICPYCPARRAMAQGHAAEAEFDHIRSDGNHVNLRLRAFPTLNEKNQVSGCIEIMEDITERTRLEEQLRQAAQLEAIGRLAGGIAHDFNNLLTAMLGYSGMILQQMTKANPYRDKVFQINRAAERASELTRQLLAFSRKQVLSVKVLDINPIIADFEKILRRLLGADIELVTTLDPALDQALADPSQVEQILLNLAINARDAMPTGGKLTMTTANAILDKDYCQIHPDLQPGRYVTFSVSDNGVGMDPSTKANIFDPFFTTKEKGKGTGLGLSTVYGIVKQHRGHVSVTSQPGSGTTFKVYLPSASPRPDQIEMEEAVASFRRGNETILVVEDEEIVRNLTTESLELLGYSVHSAGHPEEAQRFCEEYPEPIHLLLTDVCLPAMDGTRLYSSLSSVRPDMKVVYVSGASQNDMAGQGALRSSGHFLQKPFTLDILAAKVREVLDGSGTDE